MSSFNTERYLNDNGIPYRTHGGNIVSGYFNIACPFCGDHGFHRGIHPQNGYTNCWRCDKQSIESLIKELEQCSWKKAFSIVKKYSIKDCDIIESKEEIEYKTTLDLPKDFSQHFPQGYKEYIEDRGFDFLELRKKYNILASGSHGKYKFRIIIPIFMNGRMVSYVGRDVTDKQNEKYKYCEEKNVVVPRKDLLFGLDSVKSRTAILTEGVFDAINVGDGAVAMLSINFTRSQVLQLKEKGIENFYLGFDKGELAQNKAKELEGMLTFAKNINYIELPEGVDDLGELNKEDVKSLRRIIF
ncbi:MAG: hypothetical protein GQ540_03180 [Lutibacter sp.]|uniref:hypothetical protein n=1 Tax=Lutibacter sp. TaxID=1925666 RepID=UPI0019EBF63F|nr:hypothetical protein [Lutibacter sp.]NOR27514.1 hypothetical protein [Lutibacter sp.]